VAVQLDLKNKFLSYYQKAVGEFLFLGLKMTQGISVDAFSRRFGKKPCEFYPQIRDGLRKG